MTEFLQGVAVGAAGYWAVVHRLPISVSVYKAGAGLPTKERAKAALKAFFWKTGA